MSPTKKSPCKQTKRSDSNAHLSKTETKKISQSAIKSSKMIANKTEQNDTRTRKD